MHLRRLLTSHGRRTVLPAALLALLLGPAAPGQDAPAASQDPALPPLLTELDDLVKDKKMEQDLQAIALVRRLANAPQAMHPKDHDRVARALGSVFRTGKLRPVDRLQLYEETAQALGTFGGDGAKELRKAAEDNRFGRDYVRFRATLLDNLGKTQDPKQVEWLLEQALRSPEDDIMAAAGGALGHHKDMELRQRRDVVKRLLVRWGELESKSSVPDNNNPGAPVNFGPQNARATLGKVRARWQGTLATLTGQNHRSFEDWQRWLNKNPDWTPAESGKPQRKG